MTNVVIAGVAGRMGQALVRCAQRVDGIVLAGATERAGHEALGRDAGEVAGLDAVGVAVTDDLHEALEAADVVIDFTFHEAVPEHAEAAASMKRAMVIGTTALEADERAVVERVADQVPIVWAPNMSLGVNLLFALSKRMAAVLGHEYQVCIDETHHVHKLDAPSGTALRLGEKVAEGAGLSFDNALVHDEGGTQRTYPDGSIPVRSFREGEVVGDHTVSFENAGERIELTHHAWSRDAFALGALHAAQWVCTQRPRLYDMQDVLGLRE